MVTQILQFVTKYLRPCRAVLCRWQWWPPVRATVRPHLSELAQVARGQLPAFVRESKAAGNYSGINRDYTDYTD
jgi:hypothetical protein